MEVQESGNNVPIDCQQTFEESAKVESINPDYNENESATTLVQSEPTYDIQNQENFRSQIIINGEVYCEQNNASVPYSEEKACVQGVVEAQDHSSELESISLHDESIEQEIVTTLSEVINPENEALITTTAGSSHSASNNRLSVESTENKSEEISLKLEESLGSSNSVLDESLPSFIGEIDESVSLPPAEPLILDQENIQHGVEIAQEMVTENMAETKQLTRDVKTVAGNIARNTGARESSVKNESGIENISAQEENMDVSEGQVLLENVPSAVVINDNVQLNEQQSELITSSESSFQYTVLPPGENSVYQEDGTLVVEYPLNSEETNISGYIKSHEVVESSTSGENLVRRIIKEEGNLLEMIEATSEDDDLTNQADKGPKNVEDKQKQDDSNKPKRRGRKAGEGIPPHIVGAPIDNPAQDINGKGLKPRLGVKIPYRKLASQIVSTSELQNHIMERARIKEEIRSEEAKKTSFAKKLTHRLAQSLLSKKDTTSKPDTETEPKKSNESGLQLLENILAVIPSTTSGAQEQPTNPIEIVEQIVNEETITSESTSGKESEVDVSVSTSESIENAEIIFAENLQNPTNIESNSDLIAILEGDGEETSIINVPNVVEIVDTSENTSEIKEIEKEISLTEQKTPQVKEKKFFKSRDSRTSDVSKEKMKVDEKKTKPIGAVAKAKLPSAKNEDSLKSNIFDIESTSVVKTTSKNIDSKKGVEKGKSSGTIVEVEPQLKPAMVLKTYTRKRKSNDVATPEPVKKALIVPTPSSQPDPKIDCVTPVPPNVYITKSSRVIKKKVIWDPDEAMPSVRSQSKILSKIETNAKAATPSKTTVNQKLTPAKATEKKIQEKDKQADQSKLVKTNEKKVTKTVQEDKDKKITTEKQTIKKTEKLEVAKKAIAKTPEKPTTQAKIVITSSTKITPVKSPKRSTKRLTEIDKLLMDEGAANMLNDINNSDDQKRRVSGRTGSSTPTEKTQNQKGSPESKNESTEDIEVVPTTPKILRKKEGAQSVKKDNKEMKEPSMAARKMSKDSSKSSTHSPPPSPAAFTPGEVSRIIRRHSSSSFSSNEGLVQDESMDDTSEKDTEKQVKRKEAPTEESGETVEDSSSQEEQEKTKEKKKRPSFVAASIPKKRFKRENPVVANGEPIKPTEIIVKSEPGVVTGPLLKTDPSKAFTVIKMNKHYMINLTYFGGDNYLTVQLLRDLVVTLRELERTRNCSVISINSQGPNFCLGIDYKDLVESDETLRSKKISDMSNAIRDLLMCLLGFSKIIVAGVKGDCVGLGVTMLPLFDMIVATDTASFCTPYAKVGCPPEAGFLLSIPYQSNHGLASELLYTAHRMNADEAQRRGLVTKLFWPEKFDTEFRALLSHISNLSKPALMVTKRQLRQANQEMAETEITRNCRLLKKYWESEECQRDFVNYNALTFDIDHQ